MMRTNIPTLLITSVFFLHSVELSSRGASSSGGHSANLLDEVENAADLHHDDEHLLKSHSVVLGLGNDKYELIPFKEDNQFWHYGYTIKILDPKKMTTKPILKRYSVPPKKWLQDMNKYGKTKDKRWVIPLAQEIYDKHMEDMKKAKEILQAQLLNHHMSVLSGASYGPMNQHWDQTTIQNKGLEQLHHTRMAEPPFNILNQAQAIHQTQSSYRNIAFHPKSAHGPMSVFPRSFNDPMDQHWSPQAIQNAHAEQLNHAMITQQQLHTFPQAQETYHTQSSYRHMVDLPGSSHDHSSVLPESFYGSLDQHWAPNTIPNAVSEQLHNAPMAQQSFNTINQAQAIHQTKSSRQHLADLPMPSHDHMNVFSEHQHHDVIAEQPLNTFNQIHEPYQEISDPLFAYNTLAILPQGFETNPNPYMNQQQDITSNPYSSNHQGFSRDTVNWFPHAPNSAYSLDTPAESYLGAVSGSQSIAHPINLQGSLSPPRNLRISTRAQKETSNIHHSYTSRLSREGKPKRRRNFLGDI